MHDYNTNNVLMHEWRLYIYSSVNKVHQQKNRYNALTHEWMQSIDFIRNTIDFLNIE